jgi:hypothetical protein
MDLLYFGTGKADGTVVSDVEWQRFVDTEITPRFPDGFTVWDASGQWRTKSGSIEKERTHVLQIVHFDDGHESDFLAIISAYKRLFDQEAVLRVRTRSAIAFQ